MKIIDSLNLIGQPAEIPDCSRDDLPQFFVDMGFKVGAEIGTSKGRFAEQLCQAGLKLYCIDPWLDYPDYSRGDEGWQANLDHLFEKTKNRLLPYNAILVRKMSMDALDDFEDESLDFVYIDGNHAFEYVANDIAGWSKKVKKGGVVSGHDYSHSFTYQFEKIQVRDAVDGYMKANNKNFFVIGREALLEGEIRDRHRSWFFIK